MKDQILLVHRPNGPMAFEEQFEVGPNVGRAVPIAIDRESAVLCLAQPQSPDLLTPLCLHILPRATFTQTFAARLARPCLGRDRHDESLGQFPHQTDSDAWSISFVARHPRLTGYDTPRTIRQHYDKIF